MSNNLFRNLILALVILAPQASYPFTGCTKFCCGKNVFLILENNDPSNSNLSCRVSWGKPIIAQGGLNYASPPTYGLAEGKTAPRFYPSGTNGTAIGQIPLSVTCGSGPNSAPKKYTGTINYYMTQSEALGAPSNTCYFPVNENTISIPGIEAVALISQQQGYVKFTIRPSRTIEVGD